jgi:lipopolysaccharide/colanic/teichoic acid biosynthesis glycosyltransferase
MQVTEWGQEKSQHWRLDPAVVEKTEPTLSLKRTAYGPVKFLGDFTVALILLIITLPLLIISALLVRVTSWGPVVYSQIRLGRGGKPFRIFKLRTMRHNCEQKSGPQWSQPGDNRITWVGRFLRRSHLDELPQLWNVLRGDMSLVGPRPERPEFIPQLAEKIPLYWERLRVRPGITGLAQVQLPPDSDLESVRIKLAHDLHYVQEMGWWLDFRILLATGFNLLGIPDRWTNSQLRLPGGDSVVTKYEADAGLPHTNGKSKSPIKFS